MAIPNAIQIQGDLIITANVNRIRIDQNKIQITHNDNTITEYTYANPSLALGDFTLLSTAVDSQPIVPTGLTWSIISPNTIATGATFTPTVTGTGFLSVTFSSQFRLDDGLGNTVDIYAQADSATSISTNVPYQSFSVTGTYEFYYSLDAINWIATGLKVIVT